MKVNNIGQFKSINEFVEDKIREFNEKEQSFQTMFELMFREKTNVLYEKLVNDHIEKITYGQAYHEILGKAVSLRELLKSAPAGSVVGLYMNNSLEWIEMFWAILLAGYKPLLMNLRLPREVLNQVLGELSAALVITDKGCNVSFGVQTYEEASIPVQKLSENELLAKLKMNEEDQKKLEIMVMSSGTTDQVKVCSYSAGEFYYQICDSYQIIKSCDQMKKHYEGELKQLTFLPFYHVFGLIAVYIWFTFFSRTLIELRDMAPATILSTIKAHQVTHIFAVPMFWDKVYEEAIRTIRARGDAVYAKFEKGLRIAKKIGDVPLLGKAFRKKAFREVRENLFGESICFMISGGSDISQEVLTFFNGIGYHLANGYGMTEIGITSVELSKKMKDLTSGSVGKPFSSIAYKIEDGELYVRGKSMAKTIREGKNVCERGEWFCTHDLASEENGRYRILGRRDDLIISASGENLNPNLIERKLLVDGAREVALVAASSTTRQPVLLVSVGKVLDESGFEDLDGRLHDRMKELSLDTQIRKIAYVTDPLIEENDFKLKRGALSQKYEKGLFSPAVPGQHKEIAMPQDEICAEIVKLFAEALSKPVEEIRYDMDFFTEGEGTSLDYFGLGVEFQEKYEVEIPTEEANLLRSVKDFYEFLLKQKESMSAK